MSNALFEITRGQDWTGEFTPSADQVDTNITGWTITFAISTEPRTTPVLSVSATITSASLGGFKATLTAAQTATLEDRTYIWDAWRTNSGNKDPIASGSLTVITSANLP